MHYYIATVSLLSPETSQILTNQMCINTIATYSLLSERKATKHTLNRQPCCINAVQPAVSWRRPVGLAQPGQNWDRDRDRDRLRIRLPPPRPAARSGTARWSSLFDIIRGVERFFFVLKKSQMTCTARLRKHNTNIISRQLPITSLVYPVAPQLLEANRLAPLLFMKSLNYAVQLPRIHPE